MNISEKRKLLKHTCNRNDTSRPSTSSPLLAVSTIEFSQ